MKAFRTVFVVIVIALLAAVFAPLPGVKPVAVSGNVATIGTPAQAFVQSALGLPLLSPMTFSASAPVIRITSETLAVPNYACKLTAQTPADWTKMSGRQSFDAKWTLLNSGAKPWYKTAVDYKYLSGTKLHTNASIFDLPQVVSPGKKYVIAVDMEAPKYYGSYSWYTTTWGLTMGSQVFCRFSMTIVVNR